MIALTIFLFCVFAVLGTGILSGLSDFRGFIIPNAYSAVVLGLFPVCYAALFVLGGVDVFQSLSSHVVALVVVFGVTAVMFSLGVLGAADSKLASAFALWTGLKGLFGFLFFMALMGAVLAFFALLLKKRALFKNPRVGGWIEVAQAGGNKVPYGIAIVFGAFVAFYDLGYLRFDFLVDVFNL